MKKTVIIGGGGFIGANLIPNLVATGRQVVVIDKHKSSHPALREVEFIEQDCKDVEMIASFVKDAHEIIHLAYSSTPATSQHNEKNEWDLNVKPVTNLFELLKFSNLEKFIFVSTGGAIYGNIKESPISEHQTPQPISAYGKSKFEIEKEGFRYYKEFGLPFISLRPSNVFGPGQIPFRGQGLIATAFGCASESKTLSIFGKDVVRDYVYIDDLCEAMVLALESAKPGEVYNIGTGKGISNFDIVSQVREMVASDGCQLKIVTGEARDFEPLCNILDNSKFKRETGWVPKTSFNIGLHKTWVWIKTLKI